MRWLYHAVPPSDAGRRSASDAQMARKQRATSLRPSGDDAFVHCSYADRIAESARQYVSQDAVLLRIDPRRIASPVREEATPRGPMPHVYGTIEADAIVGEHAISDALPDLITGHRIALVGFSGMTLLDLVGPWEVLSRIKTMGLDPTAQVDIVALDDVEIFAASGARLVVEASSVRPPLSAYDLVVTVGGPLVQPLLDDRKTLDWLASWPENRWCASVCTGALLWGALGRLAGRQCVTHHSALETLATQGGSVHADARVIDDHGRLTAGGVTAGIDLALHLVSRLLDDAAARTIAARVEHTWPLDAGKVRYALS